MTDAFAFCDYESVSGPKNKELGITLMCFFPPIFAFQVIVKNARASGLITKVQNNKIRCLTLDPDPLNFCDMPGTSA